MPPDPQLCECSGCEAFAIFTMVWPGGPPQRVCLVDGSRAARIAEAMGFKLDIRPIPGATVGVRMGGPSLRQLLEVD